MSAPVHYKSMFTGGEKESPYLFACHLAFADVTLTIDRVEAGKVVGQGGKSSGKPVIYWREKDWRPMALNKTNGKTIVALYGTPDVTQWAGKRVTLYPTTTTFGSETVECIRIRPAIPEAPRGDFDIDGALADIDGADTDAKLTEVRNWLNRAKPPAKHRDAIKTALDRRAAENRSMSEAGRDE